MLRSLRAKMTLLVLILGIPFLIASVQGLLLVSEQNNLQERKSVAKRAFNRLARDLQGTDPRSRIAELYEQSGLDTLGAGAALVDRSGNVLWESKHRSPGTERRGTQQHVLDEGILLFVMPEKRSSDNPQKLALAIAGMGIVAYGAGAWFLVGATLKPISRLVDRVGEVRRNPSLKVTPPSTDREVVNLSDTLNRLILDIRDESEERINSYATLSHELRTPIHSLLLKLDLALGREQSRDELETTLVEVQKQVYRLKNLSEAVLTLQGLSQTPQRSLPESLDANTILEEITVDLQPLIELQKITLNIRVSSGTCILAPREHLVLFLRNLLENAVKHSPSGSTVSITGNKIEPSYLLRFLNPSIGNTQLAGNGLGLRICREIARVNGWDFQTIEENETFCAEVKL